VFENSHRNSHRLASRGSLSDRRPTGQRTFEFCLLKFADAVAGGDNVGVMFWECRFVGFVKEHGVRDGSCELVARDVVSD